MGTWFLDVIVLGNSAFCAHGYCCRESSLGLVGYYELYTTSGSVNYFPIIIDHSDFRAKTSRLLFYYLVYVPSFVQILILFHTSFLAVKLTAPSFSTIEASGILQIY